MILTCTRPFTVYACNAKSPQGNRLHADRTFQEGQRFTLIEHFSATGMATHGSKCIRFRDSKGYTYAMLDDGQLQNAQP